MINCPLCQGPLTSLEEPEILPEHSHYFHDHTCLNCQTKDCELRFNICITTTAKPDKTELINYWLKWNGYTAVVGVKWPSCEITEDWHTSKKTGAMTMCVMLYRSETQSVHLTPQNFPEKLKLFKVFS